MHGCRHCQVAPFTAICLWQASLCLREQAARLGDQDKLIDIPPRFSVRRRGLSEHPTYRGNSPVFPNQSEQAGHLLPASRARGSNHDVQRLLEPAFEGLHPPASLERR
jgi:hypothetical protein